MCCLKNDALIEKIREESVQKIVKTNVEKNKEKIGEKNDEKNGEKNDEKNGERRDKMEISSDDSEKTVCEINTHSQFLCFVTQDETTKIDDENLQKDNKR